ncbi:MAG: HesA/MoeB/ThiF family protein [Deltaproteobacteria bacterium]|nr:MAG: HesA/MoeB/ThiF family protein [Deltaproteobacteria bacterium]
MTKSKTQLHELIRKRSIKIIDNAARQVQVLEDDQATKTATELGHTLHGVYREALTLGIVPYRYIRNRDAISVQEQLELAASRVAVVGAGGLGGQVILLLARVGIGHLVVVDHDLFDETNLNRQALCHRESIGRPKSEEAVARVRSINPGVEVTPHQAKIDASNAGEILAGSDVVVDALDNVPTRFALERETKALKIPLVHGAVAGFEGRMMTIFPQDPGLKTLYGDEPVEVDDTKRPEAIMGVPVLTPSFIANLQAMEAVKIILKRGKLFRNIMLHVDLEGGQVSEFSFQKSNS